MTNRFSKRAQWDLGLNVLARRHRELSARGERVLDLTESNPTRCGLDYPAEEILRAVSSSAAMQYDPAPMGLLPAREAVQVHYRERGVDADARDILLCSSTSEAYAWLFKLLCDAGDEILIPAPSYPLFDFIAQLEDVRLVRYPLRYDGGWRLDADRLGRLLTESSRALIVVHPNNPTGSFLSGPEVDAVRGLAREHGLAIISDEVFSDFQFDGRAHPVVERDRRLHGSGHGDGIERDRPLHGSGRGEGIERNRRPTGSRYGDSVGGHDPAVSIGGGASIVRSLAEETGPLIFSLGGLSKLVGLPQMKLSWILASGALDERKQALERLEVIGDTFLSVGTPVQAGLSRLLALGAAVRAQIIRRVRANRSILLGRQLAGSPWDCLKAEGGWSSILRVPRIMSDEELALRILEEERVLVHPGHLFDFDADGYLVLSLLPPVAEFEEAVGRLIAKLEQIAG